MRSTRQTTTATPTVFLALEPHDVEDFDDSKLVADGVPKATGDSLLVAAADIKAEETFQPAECIVSCLRKKKEAHRPSQ